MTQEKAAEIVKVSKMQIIRCEKGEQEPTASRLKALCELYGVSADAVLEIRPCTAE